MVKEDACALPRRLLLQWHITERCDRHCRHCYQEGRPGGDAGPEMMARVLGQYRRFLEACRTAHGSASGHIHITGGEPLLHPAFWPLVERLSRWRRMGVTFAVLCNGGGIDPAAARRLAALRPRFVQLSLDGDPATHDRLRGAGDHQRVATALRHLRAAGVPVSLSFTIQRDNAATFPHVVRTARRAGAGVWADRLIPAGRGDALAHNGLTPGETRRFFTAMEALRTPRWPWRRPQPVRLQRALQFLASGQRPYRCSAGESLLALLPDGTLLPCRRLPLALGNIVSDDLLTIYRDSPLLQRLRHPRESIPSGCRGCLYAHHCRGGLRCLAHAVHGDPFQPDPGCWRLESLPDPGGHTNFKSIR